MMPASAGGAGCGGVCVQATPSQVDREFQGIRKPVESDISKFSLFIQIQFVVCLGYVFILLSESVTCHVIFYILSSITSSRIHVGDS